MAFKTIVLHSEDIDTDRALDEILPKAHELLMGEKPMAGIVYMGIDHQHIVIADRISRQWSEMALVGCTTDGEFSSELGYREDSIVLTLILSDSCQAFAGYISNQASTVDDENHRLYRAAEAHFGGKPKLAILFSEALKINGEMVLDSLMKVTQGQLPVVGGIAADSVRNEETVQLCGNHASPHISPILFLAGDFDYSWGIESGWEPFGDEGLITRARSNQLFEINGKPALDFYYVTLGDGMKPTNEMPIAVYDENGFFRFLRTSLQNCDLKTGAITYLGNIPETGRVRIAMVSRDGIIQGALSSVRQALSSFPDGKKPALLLAFSCSARRALLGTRTSEEYEEVEKLLDKTTAISGFFTYGEICPNSVRSSCEFHNETYVAVLLG